MVRQLSTKLGIVLEFRNETFDFCTAHKNTFNFLITKINPGPRTVTDERSPGGDR
jgi:hypothetical protein